jgi:hypothetical protein
LTGKKLFEWKSKGIKKKLQRLTEFFSFFFALFTKAKQIPESRESEQSPTLIKSEFVMKTTCLLAWQHVAFSRIAKMNLHFSLVEILF